MKKIFSVFAAMALALSAFMFTGCDEIASEMPIYDTWYKYTYDYETSSGVIQLDCYLNYQKDGISVSNNDQKRLQVEFVDGLNIVLQPSADADNAAMSAIAEGLTHNTYLYKTYAEGDDFGGTSMNKTKWLTITEFLKTKPDNFEEYTMPNCIVNKAYSPLDLSEGFDWKKILINALVGQLVD